MCMLCELVMNADVDDFGEYQVSCDCILHHLFFHCPMVLDFTPQPVR